MIAISGHAGSALAVVALVISTAFLIWVYEKAGNPAQKFGKVIAWIAIAISALLVLGQAVKCASWYGSGRFCDRLTGKEMRRERGHHMRKGGGMGMGRMRLPQKSPESDKSE